MSVDLEHSSLRGGDPAVNAFQADQGRQPVRDRGSLLVEGADANQPGVIDGAPADDTQT